MFTSAFNNQLLPRTMNLLTSEQENHLLEKIRQDNDTAFRVLFDNYYRYLTTIAYRYLKEREKAKDFAQDAFVVLWNQRKDLNIKIGLKPYLRQVVVNKCLNHLRREERLDFSENSKLPETITNIEAKLPQKDFIRIHRSYIVSIATIESFTNEFIEIKKKALPISRSYKKDVLYRLEHV